jgi:hypothetical protein
VYFPIRGHLPGYFCKSVHVQRVTTRDENTFRIKIWWEGAGGAENVVYDNGIDQEIGGGSILVQVSK